LLIFAVRLPGDWRLGDWGVDDLRLAPHLASLRLMTDRAFAMHLFTTHIADERDRQSGIVNP
jgi:hypothetical protein